MISELKEKINGLNKVVDRYQKGGYSEAEFKKALNEKIENTFSQEALEENSCGNPHNNGDESCFECEVIKTNI